MKKKKLVLDKPIRLDEEVKQMLVIQSATAGMKYNEYIKHCFIQCKSEVGLKPISQQEKHKDIMQLLGLHEDSTRDDIMGTNLVNVYDHIMSLKVVA